MYHACVLFFLPPQISEILINLKCLEVKKSQETMCKEGRISQYCSFRITRGFVDKRHCGMSRCLERTDGQLKADRVLFFSFFLPKQTVLKVHCLLAESTDQFSCSYPSLSQTVSIQIHNKCPYLGMVIKEGLNKTKTSQWLPHSTLAECCQTIHQTSWRCCHRTLT